MPGDCVCRRSEEDRAATLVEEQELRKTLRASISKLKAARPLTVIDGAATLSCAAERAATLACYREHPTEPLKCRSAVEEFMACSRSARQNAPPASGATTSTVQAESSAAG
eukprot:COSAG02_NODE_11061_length_1802_cov_173.037581_2_plen_111_part_00